jgi:hypothetical protein
MQSISANDVNFFLELETRVWSALVSGDMAGDENLLADNFLGVYSSGMAGKAEHVGQLKDGPTVATYSLSDAGIKVLAEDVVLLAYLAHWTRGEKDGVNKQETMYVTSIWQQIDGVWLNVFSQDTQAGV